MRAAPPNMGLLVMRKAWISILRILQAVPMAFSRLTSVYQVSPCSSFGIGFFRRGGSLLEQFESSKSAGGRMGPLGLPFCFSIEPHVAAWIIIRRGTKYTGQDEGQNPLNMAPCGSALLPPVLLCGSAFVTLAVCSLWLAVKQSIS